MYKTISDGFSKNGNNPPNLSWLCDKVPIHAKNHVFYYIPDETKPELGGYLVIFWETTVNILHFPYLKP